MRAVAVARAERGQARRVAVEHTCCVRLGVAGDGTTEPQRRRGLPDNLHSNLAHTLGNISGTGSNRRRVVAERGRAHREQRRRSDDGRRRGPNGLRSNLHDQKKMRKASRHENGDGKHLGTGLTGRGEIRGGATCRTAAPVDGRRSPLVLRLLWRWRRLLDLSYGNKRTRVRPVTTARQKTEARTTAAAYQSRQRAAMGWTSGTRALLIGRAQGAKTGRSGRRLCARRGSTVAGGQWAMRAVGKGDAEWR
jgi:hypothetical protein